MTRRNLIASAAGFLAAPLARPKIVRVPVRLTVSAPGVPAGAPTFVAVLLRDLGGDRYEVVGTE